MGGAAHDVRLAENIDRGVDVKLQHAQCSMAKLYASEMAGRVADRAVQIFGGRGYMRENVAERFWRELRVDRIWKGTSRDPAQHRRRPTRQARRPDPGRLMATFDKAEITAREGRALG